eukprot:14569539-Ditylum_brightwellii.AAC.1
MDCPISSFYILEGSLDQVDGGKGKEAVAFVWGERRRLDLLGQLGRWQECVRVWEVHHTGMQSG